ncbi:MAG: 16S rRNA (cytidine(1402)-2'-O)-methyltransferase [Devosia sp.]|nr:16S rRNA (cytidine(1402)-2'-O)-methyltransferase [Devosia sp.]
MNDRAKSFFIAGTEFPAAPLAAGLYVVSTPIGNLKDITLRALETLAAADLVLCEDTRHSATLLEHYGIRTRRQALHEHNERARAGEIVAMIGAGKVVAQISDAGTPLLSDPGFPLVRATREAGLPVVAIPGASALLAGLASAGLPTDAFSFVGFLPARAGARANALAALRGRSETLVFYESPRRLGEALAAMAAALGGERPAAVGLELTKRFERFEHGTLGALATRFGAGETRGEAVVLVGGGDAAAPLEGDWEAALAEALATEPLRSAVDAVTARFGLKRKEVYERALALKTEE